MSIVATEVQIDTDGNRRICRYRCQDHLGEWHSGPTIITTDPNFDAEAHKTVVAGKVARILAESEFEQATD